MFLLEAPTWTGELLRRFTFNMCKYAGSINTCWAVSGNASFFQVKELGVVIYNCSSLAEDLHKIFQSYWVMGQANSSLPQRWPAEYDAAFNKHRPLLVKAGNVSSRIYLSVSFSCFTGHHSSADSGLKNFISFMSHIKMRKFVRYEFCWCPTNRVPPHRSVLCPGLWTWRLFSPSFLRPGTSSTLQSWITFPPCLLRGPGGEPDTQIESHICFP